MHKKSSLKTESSFFSLTPAHIKKIQKKKKVKYLKPHPLISIECTLIFFLVSADQLFKLTCFLFWILTLIHAKFYILLINLIVIMNHNTSFLILICFFYPHTYLRCYYYLRWLFTYFSLWIKMKKGLKSQNIWIDNRETKRQLCQKYFHHR